jgi:putative protein-disulfide isomerase
MKPILIYCYDAYCGWCYGFSPVIKKVAAEYKSHLDSEVLSGGMILPDSPVHLSSMAGLIRDAYKTVERQTGIVFGKDYLWHVFNEEESDWYPNSLKPAIAMCVFKEYQPDLQIDFAADLQYGLHYEGRDLTDDESYRHLLGIYKIPVAEFFDKLKSNEYAERARYEFSLVSQLKVTGFPTALLQVNENKFYMIARGFATFETVTENIEKIIHSITSASSS